MSHTTNRQLTSRNTGLQDHEPERNADQCVGRQRVDSGGHDPDRQVTPAGGSGERVHGQADRHAGDVEGAGADSALGVERQSDAERGEDQRPYVGDRCLERRDRGGVLDLAHHDVLGVPAHRRCGGREHGQAAHRAAQPPTAPVAAATNGTSDGRRFGAGAVCRVVARCGAWRCFGRPGRFHRSVGGCRPRSGGRRRSRYRRACSSWPWLALRVS
jgi:hypothetical protein